jgi:hypothetical protein
MKKDRRLKIIKNLLKNVFFIILILFSSDTC